MSVTMSFMQKFLFVSMGKDIVPASSFYIFRTVLNIVILHKQLIKRNDRAYYLCLLLITQIKFGIPSSRCTSNLVVLLLIYYKQVQHKYSIYKILIILL